MEEINLKPCPFCGGKADFVKFIEGDDGINCIASIRCHKCKIGLEQEYSFSSIQEVERISEFINKMANEVIENWNTRVGE